jgi:hypothetical protein
MATATTTLVFGNASDAQFRAWGSWFDGLWATFGWTEVYSLFGTGTNWTDVTVPNAANQTRVTKIYGMGDAAANPLYIKIEYGSAAAAGTPGWRISAASSYSGGNLAGTTYFDTSVTYRGITTVNTNANNHFASGSSNRFAIAFNVTGTSIVAANQYMMTIERRKESTGVNATTGYLFCQIYFGGTAYSVGIKAGVAPNILTVCATPGVGTAANQVYDGFAAINPVSYSIGYTEFGLGAVSYPNAFFTQGATFNATLLSTTVTYMAMGTLISTITEQSSGASRLAMRYD